MRTLKILAVLVAAALAPAAFAQAQVSGGMSTAPGVGKAVAVVSASATVKSIDPATRTVVLQLANGETRDIHAGDDVRNFDQLKVGDHVRAKYMEAFTIQLMKAGKEGKPVVGSSETSSMDRSAPGQKPGGLMIHEVNMVAEVVAVDHEKKTMKLKDEHGKMHDLKLEDPEQAKLVKKGDHVQATYTTALAIQVSPAK